MNTNGGAVLLVKDQAREHYLTVVAKEIEAVRLSEVAPLRRRFVDSATVRRSVLTRGEGGKRFKQRKLVDEVVIDYRTHQVEAGSADSFLKNQAEKRYPVDPAATDEEFTAWWRQNSTLRTTWSAQLLTAETVQDIKFDHATNWDWGYPIAPTLQALDQLARQNWKVVHVSEDRGLYQGADALNESYPTRIRYLLVKEE